MTANGPSNGNALRVVLLDSIPKWGGGEKWCVEAASALGEMGHYAVVACEWGSPLAERSRDAGVETWAAPLAGARGIISAVRLGFFLREKKIEAVIGNVGHDLLIGAIACRISGARLLQRRGLVRPVKPGLFHRWLYTRNVQKIIVNSDAIRDRMLSSVDFLDPSRFALIPNGIDVSSRIRADTKEDTENARAALGFGATGPLVAAIGRLAEMKGLAHLLRAWPLVRSSVPDARLLVVGEGEEERALKALAVELRLGDSVQFLGFRRDVGDLLDAIDLIVLPSVRDEGCSNTLLEAMWHGKPAVVTRCGGLPSVVENGAQGIVVEIGDEDGLGKAIARLLTDERERGRMGAAARRAIEEKFTRDGAARMLVSLLLSLRA